jgi:hypothetical protein
MLASLRSSNRIIELGKSEQTQECVDEYLWGS